MRPRLNWSDKAIKAYTKPRTEHQLATGWTPTGRNFLNKISPNGLVDIPYKYKDQAQDLKENFLKFQEEVKARLGYEIRLMGTSRTLEEQQENYKKGRTAPGKVVTHKSGLLGDESEYQKFNAFDVNFLDPYTDDGSDPRFEEIAEIAKEMGAEWGGDWGKDKDGKIVGFNDPQHFQW